MPASGILVAREHLKYIHLSESDRGTPGEGNCPWEAIFTALAAIGFKGGLAMESFINMPPEVGARPVGLAAGRQERSRGHGQRTSVPAQQGASVRSDLVT